jgi:putative OPT family oligopeptide transporter
VIFTLPALFMWQMAPQLLQMTLLATIGGLLGVLFMVPLRRYLIEKEHGVIPYPEGTACAEVLMASESTGSQARNVFLGLAAGAVFKFIVGWLKLLPAKISVPIPGLLNGRIGMKMSAALFGVGYILGPRIASVMVAGGLLSSLLIIPAISYWGMDRAEPLFPETQITIARMSAADIWSRYVRYIGAGAVAMAGLITLARSIPVMIASFRLGVSQLKQRIDASDREVVPRTHRDLSLRVVGGGVIALALTMIVVPNVFGEMPSFGARLVAPILVAIGAFFFVTVSARIVGLVGVTANPTSGMTIASLLVASSVFLLMGWTDELGMAAALTVGSVVAIAASIAGDTSQDLKTGFLLGATPRRQQIGELIGVLSSSTFVCLTVLLLDRAYGFGSQELPAPQATLMKLVVEGVLEARLPWILVGIGAIIAIGAELLKIPSLPFAVGVYLPVSTMSAVFAGGALRWAMERRAKDTSQKESRSKQGILFGAGLVGGEGVLGVLIAAVVVWQSLRAAPHHAAGLPMEIGQNWLHWLAGVLGVADTSIEQAMPAVAGLLGLTILIAVFRRSCK